MPRLLRLAPLVALLVAVLPVTVRGQSGVTTAAISGVILDQTRAVLPGARVTIVNRATNLGRMVTAGGDGRFVAAALLPGVYSVVAEAPGFAPQTRDDIVLPLGSTIDLELTLALEAFALTVPVAASEPVVDPQRTAMSSLIARDQIENLPANGRDFISFALLTPGVTIDRTPQQGASATSGLTFLGQRARSNNIMVDGVDNNDTVNGGVRAIFSQEAVQEFQVLAGSYSAEFGNASGGVVNIITRSGTNEVAGNAFFFLRDDRLNAKEHFETRDPSGARIDRPKAPYGQKQFGFTVGGPVQRDRLFYFLSLERLDIDANNFVTVDDSRLISLGNQPIGTAAGVLRRAGFPVEIGNVPYTVETTQILGKLDRQFGGDRRLSVRFNSAANLNENIEPWGGQVARSRGAFVDSDDAMLAVSFTSLFSPTLLNELRVQTAYRDQSVMSLDPSCQGRCDREDEGGPTLEVIGVASVGRQRFTPAPRETLHYQVVNTMSRQGRRHSTKLGVDYSHINHMAGALPLHFGGRYIFAPLPAIPGLLPAPVSSIQALALGLPAAYVQGYGNAASGYAVGSLAVFAQDDWAIRPDLTVKLGLRYQTQFWPDIRYDVRGVSSYRLPSDHNNVAPRLAAAWHPGANRATTVHAVYGMFYDAQLTGLLGISDIVDGAAEGVRTLVLRFPASVAAWNAPNRRLPEPPGSYPSLVITMDPRLKTPYAHHTSVGISRQLPEGISIGAHLAYVKGRNQVGTLDYNPLVPELGMDRRPEDVVRGGIAVPGTSASILQYTSFGETWYRGVTLSFAQRFTGRHQWGVSYTLSKVEDTSTDYQSAFLPQDTGKGRDPRNPFGLPLGFDPDSERGPSVQDQRHRFVANGAYALPYALQLSSIVTVGSGRPYTVLAGVDLNGDGNGGAFPPDRARHVANDAGSSLARNSETLPIQATVDLRVSRRFRLTGRANLDAIVEIFNLLNRTNFTEINNIFGIGAFPVQPLPTYGQFEKAGPPLQAQLAVKVSF